MSREPAEKVDEQLAWEMAEVLNADDELGAVIRIHLFIERVVTDLIESRFPLPSLLPRLEYHDKVKMALACGLEPQFKTTLNKIGDIRNKFAHEHGYRLSNDVVASL